MVKLNKIYTRTGDNGETGLGNGERVSKTNDLVIAYGTVDELNSVIGIAHLHAGEILSKRLERIQNDLFDLGADLCTPLQKGEENALRVINTQILRLENEIDEMNAELLPLKSFILPGGSILSAHLHLARTITRRAERESLSVDREINPEVVRYLNRLSDWFFVAARMANNAGADDVLWLPGAHRE